MLDGAFKKRSVFITAVAIVGLLVVVSDIVYVCVSWLCSGDCAVSASRRCVGALLFCPVASPIK